MSEYQYYEFQAIDRPLHEAEQAEISRLSRRVTLTPRQAVFTYSYGDFPGNAIDVLGKYFDAMLCLANWGTKRLVFRLPRSVVDAETLAPYCFPDVISTSVTSNAVLLDIRFDEVVKLLLDLRELAQHRKQLDRFRARINQIYEDYRSRPGLLSRLGHVGLVKYA